jgi:hypothetical protein
MQSDWEREHIQASWTFVLFRHAESYGLLRHEWDAEHPAYVGGSPALFDYYRRALLENIEWREISEVVLYLETQLSAVDVVEEPELKPALLRLSDECSRVVGHTLMLPGLGAEPAPLQKFKPIYQL